MENTGLFSIVEQQTSEFSKILTDPEKFYDLYVLDKNVKDSCKTFAFQAVFAFIVFCVSAYYVIAAANIFAGVTLLMSALYGVSSRDVWVLNMDYVIRRLALMSVSLQLEKAVLLETQRNKYVIENSPADIEQ